ncbi:MAG: hypothetical protein ACRCSD_09770 [Clostridium sp.]
MTQSKDIGNAEFNRILADAKAIRKEDKNSYLKISSKEIMMDRLVFYYLSGNYNNKQLASIY